MRNREGVAYVEYALQPELRSIEGHWERPGAKTAADLEEGPGWTDPREAIAWGRKRAPHVFLRLHRTTFSYRYYRAGDLVVRLLAPPSHSHTIYSAGERHSERWGVRRWPRASVRRERDVVDGYGGDVHLVRDDEAGGLLADLRYAVRWEVLRRGHMVLLRQAGPWRDLERALAWARSRTPVVLLCQPGNDRFEYFSAGDEQPSGLALPEWPRSWEGVQTPPDPTAADLARAHERVRPFESSDDASDEGGAVFTWFAEPLVGKAFPLDADPHDPDRWRSPGRVNRARGVQGEPS